jgi:autotransporter strand-loop-strand O-heptosyltransferase
MVHNQIRLSFFDGVRVDIVPVAASGLHGNALKHAREATYLVRFLNAENDLLVYSTTVAPGCFAAPFPKYFIKWRVIVEENGVVVFDETLDLAGKKVYIQLDSKALGDTIAWFPYAEEFRKKHQCEVHVGTFHQELFASTYPNLTVRGPGAAEAEGFYAAYIVGTCDNDYNRNKNNWRLIPLQQTATDILGLPMTEIRARIARPTDPAPVADKYVAIAEFSTFDAKEWLHPGGWQAVLEYLKSKGYAIVSVSKEQTRLANLFPLGIISRNDRSLSETINNIQHAEFFIGVASGCSWLAWALEVPTVIISGFTEPYSEMTDCYRVINKSVCTGCYNDKELAFDRGNRKWCPRNKNMECSTSITPAMVTSAIDRLLRDRSEGKKAVTPSGHNKVLFLLPHCSTGGMPEYAYQCVKGLVDAGVAVAVAEWQDVAPMFDVQKRRIRSIAPVHTLNGDWRNLQRLIEDFAPDVVHLQEFAETFLPDEAAVWLFRNHRPYRLIETTHGREVIQPNSKRWLPNAFAFANQYHVEQYNHLPIPAYVVDIQLPKRVRPDRVEALGRLGLDPGRRHVLNVGLFTPGKNQKQIFEIARKLSDLTFHFVGNQAGNFAAYWEPLMAQKPDNCIVWGERSDVDQFYASMDLFLFTSTLEFNPIVIKEALSWQMPVIMRDLETYCGAYELNPLVTFFDDDDDLAGLVRDLLPTVGSQLEEAYCFSTEPPQEPVERVVITDRKDIGGWFDEANRRVLDELIKRHNIKSVIEIGSFLGQSAAWFAERVDKVTCVDTWFEAAERGDRNNLVDSLSYFGVGRDFFAKFVENMKGCGAWPKITVVRGDSQEVAHKVGEADLVYVDANHTKEGCAGDVKLYLPKARKIICGDDYTVRPEFGVIEAVSELLPRHKFDGPFWWDYAPRVAVVIPNKNYGKWLGRAIRSAQVQTIPPVAVIVVDGMSTDNSEQVARRMGATWLEYATGRMGAAKNIGIDYAEGEADFIVTLDADDWIEPSFIERSIEQMQGKDIVATQMRLQNGDIWMPAPPFTIERFVDRNLIFTTSMFRMSLWGKLGGFCEDPECYEDWDFWLRAVLGGAAIGLVNEPLFNHMEHDASSCATMTAEMDSLYREKIRAVGARG